MHYDPRTTVRQTPRGIGDPQIFSDPKDRGAPLQGWGKEKRDERKSAASGGSGDPFKASGGGDPFKASSGGGDPFKASPLNAAAQSGGDPFKAVNSGGGDPFASKLGKDKSGGGDPFANTGPGAPPSADVDDIERVTITIEKAVGAPLGIQFMPDTMKIIDVVYGKAAYNAGIQVGWRIRSVGGRQVRNMQEWTPAIKAVGTSFDMVFGVPPGGIGAPPVTGPMGAIKPLSAPKPTSRPTGVQWVHDGDERPNPNLLQIGPAPGSSGYDQPPEPPAGPQAGKGGMVWSAGPGFSAFSRQDLRGQQVNQSMTKYGDTGGVKFSAHQQIQSLYGAGDIGGDKEVTIAGFEKGTGVVAWGLKGASELNGLSGVCIGTDGDRVVIDFGDPQGIKALKPANLAKRGEDGLPIIEDEGGRFPEPPGAGKEPQGGIVVQPAMMEGEMMEAATTAQAVSDAVADFGMRNGLDGRAMESLVDLATKKPNTARLVVLEGDLETGVLDPTVFVKARIRKVTGVCQQLARLKETGPKDPVLAEGVKYILERNPRFKEQFVALCDTLFGEDLGKWDPDEHPAAFLRPAVKYCCGGQYAGLADCPPQDKWEEGDWQCPVPDGGCGTLNLAARAWAGNCKSCGRTMPGADEEAAKNIPEGHELGRIANYDVNQQLGHIAPDGGGMEIFFLLVHAMKWPYEEGVRVSFKRTKNPERVAAMWAIDVRPLGAPPEKKRSKFDPVPANLGAGNLITAGPGMDTKPTVDQRLARGRNPGDVVLECDIPCTSFKRIIGKGGENIQSLQRELGVGIGVPGRDNQDGKVTVTGGNAAATKAKAELEKKYNPAMAQAAQAAEQQERAQQAPRAGPTEPPGGGKSWGRRGAGDGGRNEADTGRKERVRGGSTPPKRARSRDRDRDRDRDRNRDRKKKEERSKSRDRKRDRSRSRGRGRDRERASLI